MAISGWDEVAESIEFTLKIDARRFQELVPRTSRILDYGCGYGRITKLLTSLEYSHVVGYDTSEAMLARGRKQYPGVTLLPCTPSEVPEPDASFDAIVGCGLLTSIVDQNASDLACTEMLRTLRPGGILHLAEFMIQPERSYFAGGLTFSSLGLPVRHFSQYELSRLFQKWEILGLDAVEARSISGAPVPAIHLFARKGAESQLVCISRAEGVFKGG